MKIKQLQRELRKAGASNDEIVEFETLTKQLAHMSPPALSEAAHERIQERLPVSVTQTKKQYVLCWQLAAAGSFAVITLLFVGALYPFSQTRKGQNEGAHSLEQPSQTRTPEEAPITPQPLPEQSMTTQLPEPPKPEIPKDKPETNQQKRRTRKLWDYDFLHLLRDWDTDSGNRSRSKKNSGQPSDRMYR